MTKLSREEKKLVKELEKKLKYKFKDRTQVKRALTHKSYANEQKLPATAHNERLEYLGDAVLELVISHLLMLRFPDSPEGELSKIRASIVNEKTLASVAESIDLGSYLYLGRGEEMGGGREKDSILSDAFEAVLGAIYLDRGFKKSFKVIQRIAEGLFKKMHTDNFYKDYKTQLQETAQMIFKSVPRYKHVSESGPDHAKTFEVNVSLNKEVYGSGRGRSKKSAEQNAAKEALERIDREQTS